MNEYLRSVWKRIMHRDLRYSDRHGRLNELYRTSDPWGMATAREQFRFRETNRLIEREFPHLGTILELGCGEGHQSEYLAKICRRLVGIDVSKRAIRRARKRVPDAEFEVATLHTSLLVRDRAPFDLVVAAEVLYYIADVPACLTRMQEIGDACFVTYYNACGGNLHSLVMERSPSGGDEFAFEGTRWTARWWKNVPRAPKITGTAAGESRPPKAGGE